MPLLDDIDNHDKTPSHVLSCHMVTDEMWAKDTVQQFPALPDNPAPLIAYASSKNNAPAIIISIGSENQTDSRLKENAHKAGALCAAKAEDIGYLSIVLAINTIYKTLDPHLAYEFADGAKTRAYRFDKYKSCPSTPLHVFHDCLSDQTIPDLDIAQTLYVTQKWARDITMEPSNVLTPLEMAKAIKKAAPDTMSVSIWDDDEIKERGLKAIQSIGKSSDNPPAIASCSYAGGPDDQKPILLVGKGVTFDAGGIAIKTESEYANCPMKTDMYGGAIIAGAMMAAAALKLPVNLVGLIGCAENLPSPGAIKPHDVVEIYGGDTIEVAHTDMEGRFIMAELMQYGIDRADPATIINAGTLSYGAVSALGETAGCYMTNNSDMARIISESASSARELMSYFPMDDDLDDFLHSEVADYQIQNYPVADTVIAGKFLEKFCDHRPWAYFDLGGVAWLNRDKTFYRGRHATGIGLRTIFQYLRHKALYTH